MTGAEGGAGPLIVIVRDVRGRVTAWRESGGERRVVTPIPMYSRHGFDVGRPVGETWQLGLSILADILGSATDVESYQRMIRTHSTPPTTAWKLHRDFAERFLEKLVLEQGEAAEFPVRQWVDWVFDQLRTRKARR